MFLEKLVKKGKIRDYPKWIVPNVHYETIMGSQAYGVTHDVSDLDVYGWCMPPLTSIFPHRAGYIGLGPVPERFDQFMQHHVKDDDDREYDFTIYSVVKYMQLVMENNPNMIDSLFTPANCVTHQTQTAMVLTENRRKFLHKGAYHKFKGYAYAQLHKIRTADHNQKKGLVAVTKFEQLHGLENSAVTVLDIVQEQERRKNSVG